MSTPSSPGVRSRRNEPSNTTSAPSRVIRLGVLWSTVVVLVHLCLVGAMPDFVCSEILPEDPPPPQWYVAMGAVLVVVHGVVTFRLLRRSSGRGRVLVAGLAALPLATMALVAVTAARVPVVHWCT